MKRRKLLFAVVAAMAALVVAACGGADPTATPQPTAMMEPTEAMMEPTEAMMEPTEAMMEPTEAMMAPEEDPIELDFLVAWPESVDAVPDGYFPFRDLIQDLSGNITVNTTGPDAVHAFEQVAPVRDGVFDMLFTHSAYHADFTTLGSAIDLAAATPEVWTECGAYGILQDAYEDRVGVKLLGYLPTDLGYRFVTKELQDIPNLEGLKLRGTASFEPMYNHFGGIMVNLPITEVYTALQKDIIDGLAMGAPEAIAWNFKFYEVASYIYGPPFSASGITLMANLDFWNSLSEARQDAIMEALDEATLIYRNGSQSKVGGYLDMLAENGMQLVDIGPDKAQNLKDVYYNQTVQQFLIDADPTYGQPLADALACAKAREGWPS